MIVLCFDFCDHSPVLIRITVAPWIGPMSTMPTRRPRKPLGIFHAGTGRSAPHTEGNADEEPQTDGGKRPDEPEPTRVAGDG